MLRYIREHQNSLVAYGATTSWAEILRVAPQVESSWLLRRSTASSTGSSSLVTVSAPSGQEPPPPEEEVPGPQKQDGEKTSRFSGYETLYYQVIKERWGNQFASFREFERYRTVYRQLLAHGIFDDYQERVWGGGASGCSPAHRCDQGPAKVSCASPWAGDGCPSSSQAAGRVLNACMHDVRPGRGLHVLRRGPSKVSGKRRMGGQETCGSLFGSGPPCAACAFRSSATVVRSSTGKT